MDFELKSVLNPDFVFSQSSLQDYFDCERRFQLRYIENLSWPAVATEPLLENERRQNEGKQFHRMIQQYILGVSEEKLSRLTKSPEFSRWWDNFLRSKLLQSGYAHYPELILLSPLGSYRLMAKYDLVSVREGNKVIIYDWKTFHRRPRDERMSVRLQTIVYRTLLVQSGAFLNKGIPFQPEMVEMIYWYSEFPSEPARFPYTMSQFNRDWQTLSSMVSEIDRQRSFPMTEDVKKCEYCPYRSYCERGEKAGNSNDVEISKDEEIVDFDLDFEQVAELEF
jgi:CRISPR/Cas system-associated exonuclease Cas4 (RecB family)